MCGGWGVGCSDRPDGSDSAKRTSQAKAAFSTAKQQSIQDTTRWRELDTKETISTNEQKEKTNGNSDD
jgi:hypothetical protein